jgi:hypothetical protein
VTAPAYVLGHDVVGEREACAAICDATRSPIGSRMAATIRARGATT